MQRHDPLRDEGVHLGVRRHSRAVDLGCCYVHVVVDERGCPPNLQRRVNEAVERRVLRLSPEAIIAVVNGENVVQTIRESVIACDSANVLGVVSTSCGGHIALDEGPAPCTHHAPIATTSPARTIGPLPARTIGPAQTGATRATPQK